MYVFHVERSIIFNGTKVISSTFGQWQPHICMKFVCADDGQFINRNPIKKAALYLLFKFASKSHSTMGAP